jgi:hypothetical protein
VPTFDAMPSGLDPSIHHTTCHPAICPHDVSASFAPIHIFCLSFSFFFFFLNMFFPNLNVPNNSSLLASSYLPIAAHCQRIQRCAINLILKSIFQKKFKKKKKSFRLFVVKRGQCHFFCTWNYGKRQNFCTPHSWSWKREGILRNLIDGAPSQISSIIK